MHHARLLFVDATSEYTVSAYFKIHFECFNNFQSIIIFPFYLFGFLDSCFGRTTDSVRSYQSFIFQYKPGMRMIMDLRKMYVYKINIVCHSELEQNMIESSFRILFLSHTQCLNVSAEHLASREVVNLDIAFDDLSSDKHYKKEEDPKYFHSEKTQRGPLLEGWRNDKPIMCSYKLVNASFEVWGFQTRVEDYIHRCISDVLLLGHRQAFTWIDSWIDMSIEDVREYEKRLQAETNKKMSGNDTDNGNATVAVADNTANDDDDGAFEDAVEVQDAQSH